MNEKLNPQNESHELALEDSAEFYYNDLPKDDLAEYNQNEAFDYADE
jgi:hypothetical protein